MFSEDVATTPEDVDDGSGAVIVSNQFKLEVLHGGTRLGKISYGARQSYFSWQG
jgi:hypothetical protein